MKCTPETVAALQLAHAELHAAESHAEQADCREELNARLGENADAILHDLLLLSRLQGLLHGVGEVATRG